MFMELGLHIVLKPLLATEDDLLIGTYRYTWKGVPNPMALPSEAENLSTIYQNRVPAHASLQKASRLENLTTIHQENKTQSYYYFCQNSDEWDMSEKANKSL